MYTVFDVDDDRVERRYLLELLQTPYMLDRYGSIGQGSINRRKSISFDTLGAEKIPLPPIAEQRKIAAILTSVDEAIQATEAVIAQTRRVKEGLLQELLTKGIGHTRFKEVNGFHMPSSWDLARIGDVGEVSNGSTPRTTTQEYWTDGDIPWIASGKVNDFVINEPTGYITKKALDECSIKLLPAGTIVIGMIGQGKTRGLSARLDIDATINQNLAAVVPGDNLNSEFLHAYLVGAYNELRGSGRGSNQDALNCSIVRQFPLPLPPVEEQQTIAGILATANNVIDENERTLVGLQQLKSGLLQDLLTGRVRVKNFE